MGHSMTPSALARLGGRLRDRDTRSLSLEATGPIDRLTAKRHKTGIKLIVSSAASKALVRLPRRDREALLDKVEAFAVAPNTRHPAATPLRGHPDLVRLRQGDWRGICRVDRSADTIVLETVAHRREVYR